MTACRCCPCRPARSRPRWRGSSGRGASATPRRSTRRSPACATPRIDPGTSDTNLMPHFIRCAAAYATLGEQCAVLREVFGEYREPVAV